MFKIITVFRELVIFFFFFSSFLNCTTDVLIGVGLGCLLQMGPSKTVLQVSCDSEILIFAVVPFFHFIFTVFVLCIFTNKLWLYV